MQKVFHRRFSTELGELELAATPDALVGLEFINDPEEQPPAPHASPDASALLDLAEREIREYLAGTRRTFTVPLDLSVGTEFQQEVWQGLQGIGYGETLSYHELACCVGHPRAARAVGNANHRNPISIIVPCHRVIAADGSLGGYGGKVWRKQFLLDLESQHPVTPLS